MISQRRPLSGDRSYILVERMFLTSVPTKSMLDRVTKASFCTNSEVGGNAFDAVPTTMVLLRRFENFMVVKALMVAEL
jgi:hypothetical protein